MNAFQKSMSGVRATEELKRNTLQYLNRQQEKKNRTKLHLILRYALVAACLLLLVGTGSYSVYRKPVSYISIDVNPSIELGINRFGKVVSAEAYNEDGQNVLQHVSVKNISYIHAINRLLTDESDLLYLQEDSLLVFTVISDQPHSIMEEIRKNEFARTYETLMYTSDTDCMEEAHSHEMSFGVYRAYLELSQYDSSVTVEDCHGMSIGEIQTRIEGCRHHNSTRYQDDQVQNETLFQGQEQDETPRQDNQEQSETQGNHNRHHGGHH